MDVLFYSIYTGICGLLYLLLAFSKNKSLIWWTLGGMIIVIPVILLASFLEQVILNPFLDSRIYTMFISLGIYLVLLFFVPKSLLTEAERKKVERIQDAIYEGFRAVHEKRLEDAYKIFQAGLKDDPTNPILRYIVYSFKENQIGQIEKQRRWSDGILDRFVRIRKWIKGN